MTYFIVAGVASLVPRTKVHLGKANEVGSVRGRRLRIHARLAPAAIRRAKLAALPRCPMRPQRGSYLARRGQTADDVSTRKATARERPFRIVMTGGPGGGKTTPAELRRRELGDRVVARFFSRVDFRAR